MGICMPENNVGYCSLKMWTRTYTGEESNHIVYNLLYDNYGVLFKKKKWKKNPNKKKKKKPKNIIFILKYTCCSLENVLFLFIFFLKLFQVLKSVQVMAAVTLILQVLLDFALACHVVKSWLWHKRFYKYIPVWKVSFWSVSLVIRMPEWPEVVFFCTDVLKSVNCNIGHDFLLSANFQENWKGKQK